MTILRARLRAGERVVRLENELIEAKERLSPAAQPGDITSVWNERDIVLRLSEELSRTRRDSMPLSIGLARIDNFAALREKLGASGLGLLRDVGVSRTGDP